MLEVFRRQSRSILIYVFFGIIIAVFIINFGPQSQGCTGSANPRGVAVKVGPEELSEGAFSFGWFVYGGANMPPDRARSLRLKERIMGKLIERELLAQEGEQMGMAVSPRDVEEMLEKGNMIVLGVRQNVKSWIFKKDRFDRKLLERFVRFQLNISLKRFIEEQQREMLAERMREFIRSVVKVSPAEVRQAWEDEKIQVNLAYARFDPKKTLVGPPTKDEVAAYAKEHAEEIEKYYKDHPYEFKNLKSQARVRHILFKVPEKAKPAEQKKKEREANAALARARKGQDFAALASKLSEDPATKVLGGDIGWAELTHWPLGMGMSATIEKAKVGEVIPEVLKSDDGLHVVQVVGKREGDQELDKVRDEIATKLLMEQRRNERAQKLANEAFEQIKGGAGLETIFQAKPGVPAPGTAQPESAPAGAKEEPGVVYHEETGMFRRRGAIVPKIGVSSDMVKAAFKLTKHWEAMPKVYKINDQYIVAQLKGRDAPEEAEFAKQKLEISDRYQLEKWKTVVGDWAHQQCLVAEKAGKIQVNHALLTYEGREPVGAEPPKFEPCKRAQ